MSQDAALKNTTLETWNKLADLYEEKFMPLRLYDESYECFRQLLGKETASILDLGCGPGNVSGYLFSRQPAWTFHGMDASENMLRLYQKNIPGSDSTVMDIRQLAVHTKIYDGIVAGFCIPYLNAKDTADLISVCRRLLAPGGCLYISFVEGAPEASGPVTGSTGYQTYFYYHREEYIRELMQAAGFHLQPALHITYQRPSGQEEIHTVLMGRL